MKKIFILTFGLMSTAVCCAQDLIVKNDGDEIKVIMCHMDGNSAVRMYISRPKED